MKHKLHVYIDEFMNLSIYTKPDPSVEDYINDYGGLILELDIDEERLKATMFEEVQELDLKQEGGISFNN